MKLTIVIDGKQPVDLVEALAVILRRIEEGYIEGFDRNESGRYQFRIEGGEEPEEST